MYADHLEFIETHFLSRSLGGPNASPGHISARKPECQSESLGRLLVRQMIEDLVKPLPLLRREHFEDAFLPVSSHVGPLFFNVLVVLGVIVKFFVDGLLLLEGE